MMPCKFLFLSIFYISMLLATSVSAQTKEVLCPLAQRHLSTTQIGALKDQEIKALNFLFTSTYLIKGEAIEYEHYIKDNGPLDVTLLYQFRKQSERAVYKNEKYPGMLIELMSWDEVNAGTSNILNAAENLNK